VIVATVMAGRLGYLPPGWIALAVGIALPAVRLPYTFAVELEEAVTPVVVISKLLGHSSIAVTARYSRAPDQPFGCCCPRCC
jgi:hypothetical protein